MTNVSLKWFPGHIKVPLTISQFGARGAYCLQARVVIATTCCKVSNDDQKRLMNSISYIGLRPAVIRDHLMRIMPCAFERGWRRAKMSSQSVDLFFDILEHHCWILTWHCKKSQLLASPFVSTSSLICQSHGWEIFSSCMAMTPNKPAAKTALKKHLEGFD